MLNSGLFYIVILIYIIYSNVKVFALIGKTLNYIIYLIFILLLDS